MGSARHTPGTPQGLTHFILVPFLILSEALTHSVTISSDTEFPSTQLGKYHPRILFPERILEIFEFIVPHCEGTESQRGKNDFSNVT